MALLFHLFGIPTWNFIIGAAGSTGLISPETRQYSVWPAAFVALTITASVTTAPDEGRAMADAGMVIPENFPSQERLVSLSLAHI